MIEWRIEENSTCINHLAFWDDIKVGGASLWKRWGGVSWSYYGMFSHEIYSHNAESIEQAKSKIEACFAGELQKRRIVLSPEGFVLAPKEPTEAMLDAATALPS